MDPAPRTTSEEDPTRGAVPVDRVLVVRVNEGAQNEPEAPKETDGHETRLLEWIKAMGMPLVTLLVTVVGGYFVTNLTKAREARESDERLYAQLLTQREQSDALIRKDMFRVVMEGFLSESREGGWSDKVLKLELLANNFSQSIDLTPLFKDLARKLSSNPAVPRDESARLRKRLDVTAANLIFKQVNGLARRGYSELRSVPLGDWEKRFGQPFIKVTVPRSRFFPTPPNRTEAQIEFSVEVVDVSFDRREVEVRLVVRFFSPDHADVDRHFWVGQYDFPMLDNTQLPDGLRASVVITEFFVPEKLENREQNAFAIFHLVVFPAASASFKERQDFDDILLDLLRTRGREGDRP